VRRDHSGVADRGETDDDGDPGVGGRTKVIPTVLVVGASGSGKTMLIERVVPHLHRRGFAVGTVKHASGGFEVDRPSKDLARHFAAGATTTLLVGSEEQVLFARGTGPLSVLVTSLFAGCDVVLAEGFSWERGPKLVVHRSGLTPKPRPPAEGVLVAVTDEPLGYPVEVAPEKLDAIAESLATLINTTAGHAR
jgi:molybdopterin-guanine dinucleotide biosynthesis protein MobB